MKSIIFAAITFCVMATMTASAQSQPGTKKILIAYFSMPETGGVDAVSGASRVVVDGKVSGNVAFVANGIQKATGGDIFAITTARPYPGTHDALTAYAKQEKENNARPRLSGTIANLQDYDTIFLGYPIWWYDLPMPFYCFLEQTDLSGKTIIPFTVHGGSGLLDTVDKIAALQPGAKVIKNGLSISRNNVARSAIDITAWLRRIGMIK